MKPLQQRQRQCGSAALSERSAAAGAGLKTQKAPCFFCKDQLSKLCWLLVPIVVARRTCCVGEHTTVLDPKRCSGVPVRHGGAHNSPLACHALSATTRGDFESRSSALVPGRPMERRPSCHGRCPERPAETPRMSRSAARARFGMRPRCAASAVVVVAFVLSITAIPAGVASPVSIWQLQENSASQYLMSNFFPMPRGTLTFTFWMSSPQTDRAIFWYGGGDGMAFAENLLLLWTKGTHVEPWFSEAQYSGMSTTVRAPDYVLLLAARVQLVWRHSRDSTVKLTEVCVAADVRAGMAPLRHDDRRKQRRGEALR